MVKALTNRFVAGIRPTGRFLDISDKTTRGLTLRVGARTKVWYFSYRNGGPSQRLRLGEYPALELADARKEVNEQRRLLDKGLDPIAERRKAEAEPAPTAPQPPAFTFTDFIPVFVAFQKGKKKTWADDEAAIDLHLQDAWGTLPLKEITRQLVHERLDALVSQGLTVGVNRIQALISRIFTVAMDRGLVDANPANRMIKRFSENARDRVLTDDEIRALWAGLDAHPGVASEALKLRLLLGQRGEETAGMLHGEVDLDAATWTLPAGRTKNKRQHIVALPPTALEIVKARYDADANHKKPIFPDLDLTANAHTDLSVIHGGAYEWTDLRRTVSTRLAGLGFDETTIGRVLNHARYTVTAKHYNQHVYVEEIRQALTAWGTELERIRANEQKSRNRVLPMRRRS